MNICWKSKETSNILQTLHCLYFRSRFNQVLAVQQTKSFNDFKILDSALLSTEEMADIVIKAVKLDL